ncbi:DUF2812 domain-containing protein [Virgibacillus kimchii]
MFRPFWSFDIRKTEEWLHEMAMKGYKFVKLNTTARLFYFEKTEKRMVIQYHVKYGREERTMLPLNLVKAGWLPVYQGNRWNIIYNENKAADIISFPVRDGVIKRNIRMMYIFTGMTVYIWMTTMLFLIICGFILFIAGGTLTFDGSIFWVSAFLVGLIFWLLAPYGVVKLYKTNKQFL